MAKAFRQHITMWLVLVVMFGLSVAGAVWLKTRQDRAVPAGTQQTAEKTSRTIPPSIDLKKVAAGLNAPVDIASNGQDDRLYVVEQGGLVRIVEDGRVSEQTFLDISGRVIFSGEQGLLGLVFDPNFSDNGHFYVNYIEASTGGRRTVVSRFTANEDGTAAQEGSEKIILKTSQPYTNHNGGDLNFGPDGYLYIALGDGGSAGDPQNRAQSGGSFLGKILRIDVNSEQAYSVPADNPFVSSDDFRPEIWSLGWRNPWRFSFDSQTGDMWIADVGQNQFEEVNREPAGKSGRNYGWRCFEAADQYNDEGCRDKSNYTFPVAVYEHKPGQPCGGSVSGGYVYRGEDYPQLNGFYFYADYCSGDIYSLDAAQATYTSHLTMETQLRITTFGVDKDGELYLADVSEGAIYQVVGQP